MNVYEIRYNIGNRNRVEMIIVVANGFCEALQIGLQKILKTRKENEYYNLFGIEKTRKKALLKSV